MGKDIRASLSVLSYGKRFKKVRTQILYGGIDIFSGIGPVPNVAKADEMISYHDRWAAKSNFTLNGYITGSCLSGYNSLINNQRTLIQRLSNDFQSLSVLENNQTIYSAPYTTISSIQFDSANYVRVLPYKISLSSFQQNLFSGVYGVIDPENSISWNEGDDGIVTVNRNLSAKGFNTNSSNRTNNALTNAKSYVQSLTGFNSAYFSECLPAFINYNPSVVPCIREIKENVDRLTATYSVQETYTYDQKSNLSYILKYSTEFNYDDKEGIYNASIKGTLQACHDTLMSDVRIVYKSIDLYSITNFEFQKTFGNTTNLNPEFLTESINENTNLKTIEFSKSWDSDPRGLVLFDYTISTEYSYIDDIRSITVEGVISARNSQKVRWDRVLEYYAGVNVFNIAQSFYIARGYDYQLVKYPSSYTVKENKQDGTITINATYTDKIQPPSGFDNAEWSIEIVPPLEQIIPIPVLCGNYYLLNINALKRGSITVNGNLSALSSSDKTDEVRAFANTLLLDYIPSDNSKRVVKESKINYVKDGQMMNYNFERQETFMGDGFQL